METTPNKIYLYIKPQSLDTSYKSDYTIAVIKNNTTIAIFGQSYATNLLDVASYIAKCLSYLKIFKIDYIEYFKVIPGLLPSIDTINSRLKAGDHFIFEKTSNVKLEIINHG